MKRGSTWLIIRETQNYNEISPHTTQNAYRKKKKKSKKINARGGVERRGLSYTIIGNVNLCSHNGEQHRGSLNKKKLKVELQYDLAIPLLGIYPEKNVVQEDICNPPQHCLQWPRHGSSLNIH